MNLAHVKWFVETEISSQPALTNSEIIFIASYIGIGLAVFYLLNNFIKKRRDIASFSDKLQILRPWLPLVVRLSLALMLIYASLNSYVFVPNLENINQSADFLIKASSFIAIFLVLGLGTRYAALGVSFMYFLAVIVYGLTDMLDHVELLGLSIFLIIEGSGKFALDNFFDLNDVALKKYRALSMRAVTAAAGISFIALALSEKLANLKVSATFLVDYHWNFLSFASVSDRGFIIFIGASELLLGLLLVLNWASRAVVLILLVLLLTTAILLGLNEVVGHAFALAVVLAAWINIDLPLMKTKLKSK